MVYVNEEDLFNLQRVIIKEEESYEEEREKRDKSCFVRDWARNDDDTVKIQKYKSQEVKSSRRVHMCDRIILFPTRIACAFCKRFSKESNVERNDEMRQI